MRVPRSCAPARRIESCRPSRRLKTAWRRARRIAPAQGPLSRAHVATAPAHGCAAVASAALPLDLPRLARGVAPVALGLALRCLGGIADHLLDRLALLACLAFSLFLGRARHALGGLP